MQTFKSGVTTSITIPFVDDDGGTLVPTALAYRLLDEAGAEVTPSTAIDEFNPSDAEVTIELSGEQNAVTPGVFAGYRRLELAITTERGVFVKEAEYLLRAASALVPMSNSFQTYEQALVLSMQLGKLEGWERSDAEARKSALAKAFDNIASFAYRMYVPNVQTGKSDEHFGSMREVTAEEFLSLAPTQQADFRKAQIVEADYLLGGAPVEKKIADGQQSETVGESSMFFRPRASLVLPISRAARSYIARYIVWSRSLGRS